MSCVLETAHLKVACQDRSYGFDMPICIKISVYTSCRWISTMDVNRHPEPDGICHVQPCSNLQIQEEFLMRP